MLITFIIIAGNICIITFVKSIIIAFIASNKFSRLSAFFIHASFKFPFFTDLSYLLTLFYCSISMTTQREMINPRYDGKEILILFIFVITIGVWSEGIISIITCSKNSRSCCSIRKVMML